MKIGDWGDSAMAKKFIVEAVERDAAYKAGTLTK